MSVTLKFYLKGGVSTSIDENGIMTKSMTWMVLDADHNGTAPEDNPLLYWMALESSVEKWAGKTGDYYRAPIQSGREVVGTWVDDGTDITETPNMKSSAFIVTSVNIELAEGRTHYEVSYTCRENPEVLRRVSDASISITSTKEKTKSISYDYFIPDYNGNPNISDGSDDNRGAEYIIEHTFPIGGVIDWCGTTYLIDNVDASEQSKCMYHVSISLKDMSKMRIGLVTINEDSFGQKTLNVTWRLSKAVYDTTTLPSSGDKLKESAERDWLGDGYENTHGQRDITYYGDYIITSVEHSPDGCLGYLVTINAKDTRTTMLHSNADYKWNGSGIEKSASVTYQVNDVDNINEVVDKLGKQSLDIGYDDFTLRDASVNQNGKNDYQITYNMSDDTTPLRITSIGNNSEKELEKDIQISMNYGTFYLTPQQCGLKRSVSNLAYYPINKPPKQTWRQKILISDLQELDSGWTDAYLHSVLSQPSPRIGFSKVVGVFNPNQKWINYKYWGTAPFSPPSADSDDFIYGLLLEDYIYPQPIIQTKEAYGSGPKYYNAFFTPWVAQDELLIIPGRSKVKSSGAYLKIDLSNWPQYADSKLDMELPEHWLNRKIPFMDCTVTMNYKGNLQTVLSKNWGTYFIKAVEQVCNKVNMGKISASTSYSDSRPYTDNDQYYIMPYRLCAQNPEKYKLTAFKRTSMSVARIIDTKGHDWTQITMGIQALLGDFWNPQYKDKVDFAND